MRVVPDGEMPLAAGQLGGRNQVAIGEQHRRLRLRRFEPDCVDAHHVGPVEEIGDASEAVGLALRAIDAAGAVEAHQLGVGTGIECGLDPEREGPRRRRLDRQPLRRDGVQRRIERHLVEQDGIRRQLVAVEHERRAGMAGRVRAQLQLRAHLGPRRIEDDVEIDRVDQPIGGTIILEADQRGVFGAHGSARFLRSLLSMGPEMTAEAVRAGHRACRRSPTVRHG
jgi:hypothetical protein